MRIPLLAAAVLCSIPGLAAADDKPLKRSVDVAVNYSFSAPISATDDVIKQQAASRKFAYEIAGQECEVLLATLAAECRISRINVNSSQQRSGAAIEPVQINANVVYSIDIKQK